MSCTPSSGSDQLVVLNKKAAVKTSDASLAVLSHLRSVSWEILREAGGVDAKAAFLAIRPKLLLSLECPVLQAVGRISLLF